MANKTVLAGAWRALVDAYGGVFGFSRHALVTPGTVYRWGTGRVTPGPNTRYHVSLLAKNVGVQDPWQSGK